MPSATKLWRESSLKNALTIDPNNVNALKFAAELALTDSDTEQAALYTDLLSKLSPNRPSTIVLAGSTSGCAGKTGHRVKTTGSY